MNNKYKDRGIFTGMDEDSYQRLKQAFNLPEQNLPKKAQSYDGQTKTRNNRRHKKSNNK